jgi:hypothetical protein
MAGRLPSGLKFYSHSACIGGAFSYSTAVAKNAAGGAGNFLFNLGAGARLERGRPRSPVIPRPRPTSTPRAPNATAARIRESSEGRRRLRPCARMSPSAPLSPSANAAEMADQVRPRFLPYSGAACALRLLVLTANPSGIVVRTGPRADFGAALDAIEAARTNERERFFRALIAEAAPPTCERFNASVGGEHGRTIRDAQSIS